MDRESVLKSGFHWSGLEGGDMKEYTEKYAMWLEDTLFKILTKKKHISDRQLKIKLENENIEYVDEFVGYLLDINEENRLRSTIEFLDTYPVSLQWVGLCDEEVQKVNKWEIGVIIKLVLRLKEEHEYIRYEVYADFFKESIEKYKPYFLDETYVKMLPHNVFKYWFCRIDTNIPWNEMNEHPENIAIDITAMIEGEYLDIDKDISYFHYLIGGAKC